jgi:mono/diheme cytochrome c family protein
VAFVAIGVTLAMAVLAAQGGRRVTRPQVVPPQGAVRQVIFTHCTSCHGIDDYAYNALDRAGWDAHLTAKHRGLDVPLPAEQRGVLLDWLAARFGPTTKPFPRAYVPTEATTFLTDQEGDALIRRACSSCHGAERVNEARHTAERWRAVAVDMRERGARITDAELERLVEWLGRVKGTNDNQ